MKGFKQMNINITRNLSVSFVFLLIVCLFLDSTRIFSEDDAYTYFAKGQTAFFNKQYRRAIPFFTQAIRMGDTSFLPFYFRGLSYLYSNYFDSAVVDLAKAAEKNDQLPDIFNNLGLAYLYNGELKLAFDNFSHAISLDTNFAEAYSNRASVNIEIGEIESAFADLEKAIKLKPKNPINFYERGRANYKSKEYQKAIKDFSKAIKLGLKNSKIFYNRGNAFFKLGKYREAIADYSKCLELDSFETDALNNRAVAYDKIGQIEKAKEDRRRLAKIAGYEDLFTPFEEIQFAQYSDSNGYFSFLFPSKWNILKKPSNEFFELIVSPEEISNDTSYYSVGIRFVFNPDMEKRYKVRSPSEILDFWRGSIEKNATELEYYQYIRQKIFARANYTGTLYETVVQFQKNTPYYRFYELALAKEGTLIFAFFQAPEVQFEYFRKIFDKVLDTLVILK